MEAANNLKNQNSLHRKDVIEVNLNKNAEIISSPNYDAELNAATASIISLPIETSSPIISTHADVRLFNSFRANRFFLEKKFFFTA